MKRYTKTSYNHFFNQKNASMPQISKKKYHKISWEDSQNWYLNPFCQLTWLFWRLQWVNSKLLTITTKMNCHWIIWKMKGFSVGLVSWYAIWPLNNWNSHLIVQLTLILLMSLNYSYEIAKKEWSYCYEPGLACFVLTKTVHLSNQKHLDFGQESWLSRVSAGTCHGPATSGDWCIRVQPTISLRFLYLCNLCCWCDWTILHIICSFSSKIWFFLLLISITAFLLHWVSDGVHLID